MDSWTVTIQTGDSTNTGKKSYSFLAADFDSASDKAVSLVGEAGYTVTTMRLYNDVTDKGTNAYIMDLKLTVTNATSES